MHEWEGGTRTLLEIVKTEIRPCNSQLIEFQVLEKKKPAGITAAYDLAGGSGGSRTCNVLMISASYNALTLRRHHTHKHFLFHHEA
jgi:hypothetical protein